MSNGYDKSLDKVRKVFNKEFPHPADATCALTELGLEVMGLKGPNFDGTPDRVSRMLEDFFSQPSSCNMTAFPPRSKTRIITMDNFTVWSFCPHHCLPVKYTLKVGYWIGKEALGLSKLGRAAQCVMQTLPLQEDVPELIAEQIEKAVKPKGVALHVRGDHLCMQMRGLADSCVNAAGTYFTGIFVGKDQTLAASLRDEFLRM